MLSNRTGWTSACALISLALILLTSSGSQARPMDSLAKRPAVSFGTARDILQNILQDDGNMGAREFLRSIAKRNEKKIGPYRRNCYFSPIQCLFSKKSDLV